MKHFQATSKHSCLLLVWIAMVLTVCRGFVASPRVSSKTACSRDLVSRKVGDVFGSLFGNQKQQDPNKPTRVVDIPVKDIKIGGLRFFLGIYLVGEQNKPEPGSWKVDTVGDNINLYYKDNSAMCTISFEDYAFMVDRYGSPSLEYTLQESVMLHGLLDELNKVAFEMDDIDEENRLIRLMAPGDAIETARAKLPAIKEE